MSSPYEAPKSAPTDVKSNEPPSGKHAGMAVASTLMASVILVGLAIFVFDVYQTVETVVRTGTGDPKLLAGHVSQAMIPLIVLGLISSVGLLFMLLVAVFTPYRKKWFLWASLVLSVVHLVYIPIGTVMALIYLIVLFKKRHEFRSHDAGNAQEVA